MSEVVYKLDNWALIKLLGGIAIIVTAIISFVGKIVLNRLNVVYQFKYNKDIENIKSELGINHSIFSTLSQRHFNNSHLQQLSVEAYQILWSDILRIYNQFPAAISAVLMLYPERLFGNIEGFNKLKQNKKLVPVLDTYDKDEESLRIINKDGVNIEEYKPFLSDKVFLLYYTYRAFIGAVCYNFIKDYNENQNIFNWKTATETTIPGLLKEVLSSKELEQLNSIKMGSFEIAVNLLQTKILAEIRNQLKIEITTQDSIEYLKQIEKILSVNK